MSSEDEAARRVLPLLDTPEHQIRLSGISPGLANALLDAMPDDHARINYLSRNLFSSMANRGDLKAAERILQRLSPDQQADTYSRWIDSWQNGSNYPQPSGTPLLEAYLKVSRIPEDEQTRLIQKARLTGK